ncbi:hypothetical protein ACWGB8_31330 [Kitasatospora sp. NPDC054939]
MTNDRGSTTYLDFISDLLATEEARKASLEARGIAVVTTSGVLASLLLGLVAVIAKSTTFVFPDSAHAPLLAGGVLFVIAAVLGILANVPFFYKTVKPSSLAQVCTDLWADTSDNAELMVSSTRIALYASARSTNSLKAMVLVAALTAEVAALVPIVIAVADVLTSQ